MFRIDPESGVLRANEVFDREKTQIYEFTVLAGDNPSEPNSTRRITQTRVRLTILDVNDNKPIISYNGTRELINSTYLFVRVDENVPVETELGKFECRDIDANSQTRMTLLSSYDLALTRATGSLIDFDQTRQDGPFTLDSFGRLRVHKRLDRETQDVYEYILVCNDSLHNSTLNVHIRLNDVNDNCPRVLNKTIETAKLTKSVFVNRDEWDFRFVPLFTEYYTDDDSGKNARLRFALDSHVGEFEVNATESTDQIYGMKLSIRNSRIKLGKYVVKLSISDQGNPSCIKTDRFVVYIGDNSTRTQLDLISRINSDSGFVNDELIKEIEEDSNDDDDKTRQEEVSRSSVIKVSSLSVQSRLSVALSSLRKTDYFILATLVATLVVIGSILSLVGLIFFCRRDRSARRGGGKKSSIGSRGLEVKNFRGAPSGLSSAGSSGLGGGGGGDDETPSEMNNLLTSTDDPTAMNRLSLSIKSTDQSQSADSVASNITFARDTSSSSSQSDEHHHHHIIHQHQQQQQHLQHEMIASQYKPAYGAKVTFGTVARGDDFQSKV